MWCGKRVRESAMKFEQMLGIAFYSREEWEALRAVAPDADVLEETYDEWLTVYRSSVASLRAAGIRPKRVAIQLGQLQEWCRLNGRRPDAEARAAYASDVLRRLSIEGFVLPDA